MTQTRPMTDHQLKISISTELIWTPSVNADHIGVAVTDGAVTLSGQVQTYPEKDIALHAAMRVHGVTAVVDDIDVQDRWGTLEDADIAREAGTLFEHSTVIVPKGAVTATVHDHVVTLSGEVKWRYEREAARQAIAALPGVRSVQNLITVKPTAVISPVEAKAKITAALVRNARLDAKRIDVTVEGSEVTLTGTVASFDERRHAEDAAWFAPGVTHVENKLNLGF
ncbi:BON domain-containing protein [Amycolatopsis sp. H20-H5]|uniref:BON domain-containing protein n=1 Tax=Amycolatopsis sp. H20-H5 TaxID=3046309 RepID=UPI002DC04D34|nr:BON domain-containing protein [Amycolatopsis sp. H20-H5]MEC3982598.1 BON domain-containing protein [Amycolatopsis sp. H20-H5]